MFRKYQSIQVESGRLTAAELDRTIAAAAAAAADAELAAATARAAATLASGRAVPSALDTTAIEARLRDATPGPWRRHGCDVWSDAAPGVPLFITPPQRDCSGAARAQADRDAEFVAHAAEDIRALLDELSATVPFSQRATQSW
jgi:hypothetical protein